MRATVYLLLAGLSAPLTATAGALSVTFEPNEGIGENVTFVHHFSDSDAYTASTADGLSVYMILGSPSWTLNLSAGYGVPMKAACYERATKHPDFGYRRRPSLNFGYAGENCGEPRSRFRIIELSTDESTHKITRLALDFVQHCSLGTAVFGKLRFGSDVPLDTPLMETVFETSGSMQFTSGAGDFVGQGEKHVFPIDRFLLRAIANHHGGVSLYYAGRYMTIPSWHLHFAASDMVPLSAGDYPDAERYPFQSPGHPGLAFAYDGSACNEVVGRFSVGDIRHDRIDGMPVALDASFEQRCDHADAPPLVGNIDFTTTFRNGPLVDDTIQIDGFDEFAEWPLIWECH